MRTYAAGDRRLGRLTEITIFQIDAIKIRAKTTAIRAKLLFVTYNRFRAELNKKLNSLLNTIACACEVRRNARRCEMVYRE